MAKKSLSNTKPRPGAFRDPGKRGKGQGPAKSGPKLTAPKNNPPKSAGKSKMGFPDVPTKAGPGVYGGAKNKPPAAKFPGAPKGQI